MNTIITSADLAAYLTNPTPELEEAIQEKVAFANGFFTNSIDVKSSWIKEVDRELLTSGIESKFICNFPLTMNHDKSVQIDLNHTMFVSLGEMIVRGFDFEHNFDNDTWKQILHTFAKATSTSDELWHVADCSYGMNPYKFSFAYRYFNYILDRTFNPVYGNVKQGSIPVEKLSKWLRVVSTIVDFSVWEVWTKIEDVSRTVLNQEKRDLFTEQDQDEAK